MTATQTLPPLGTEVQVARPGTRKVQTWVITGYGLAENGQEGMVFGRLPSRSFPGDFRSGELFLGEATDLFPAEEESMEELVTRNLPDGALEAELDMATASGNTTAQARLLAEVTRRGDARTTARLQELGDKALQHQQDVALDHGDQRHADLCQEEMDRREAQVEADRLEDIEREMADEAARARDEESRMAQDRADEESAALEALEETARVELEMEAELAEDTRPPAEVIVPQAASPEFRSHWSHMDLGGAREMVRRDTLAPGDSAWSSHYGLGIVGYVHTTGVTTEVVWMSPEPFSRSERYQADTTVPLRDRASTFTSLAARVWLEDIHRTTQSVACPECRVLPGQACLVITDAETTVLKLGGHWKRYRAGLDARA